MSAFPVPAESAPKGIVAGPDNRMWIALSWTDQIAAIVP
jgi:streptogramin lyase